MRLSISTRLAAWYGLTLLVLLGLFAAFSYASFHQSLHRDFDRHLTHERRELEPFLRVADGRPVFVGLDGLRSVAFQTDGVYGTYVRLFDASGTELYRSPNFAGHEPLAAALPARGAAPREARVSQTWEGWPARTLYFPVQEGEALAGWLEVTGFEWTVHQELRRLAQTLAAGIALSLLFAVGAGLWLARRALRPVAALTDAANRIRPSDLGARLPTEFGVRDELSDLAETFNAMLGRLEASVERERRFTANAAHELLTPLATLRSEAEVALRRERTPEAYRQALAGVIADADRMTASVRGLLQLAQTDRPAAGAPERVDLGALAQAHAARFHARADAAGVALAVEAPAGVTVKGDPRRLGEAVDNLLDNALKYASAGGRVGLSLRAERGEAVLRVEDAGVGFAPEAADRLFDRFYRADTPEVQAQPGSGLGLAIVRTIAEAHGGAAEAASPGPGRGATFALRLPLAEPQRQRG